MCNVVQVQGTTKAWLKRTPPRSREMITVYELLNINNGYVEGMKKGPISDPKQSRQNFSKSCYTINSHVARAQTKKKNS